MAQASLTHEQARVDQIEAYLDAAPRSAANAETVGPFTLFRGLGPWPFYARPHLGLTQPVKFDDVARLRSRQRELSLTETIEWVLETTPSLAGVARAAGLVVSEYPLMLLDRDSFVAVVPPAGVAVCLLDHDDKEFASAHAVAAVGFRSGGTAAGPEGAAERDSAAEATPQATSVYMRGRARDGLSISAAAFDESGAIGVGTHQPVGSVTEIVGVATLPSARRRGIGAAVTSVLVEDAFARGLDTVFLSAGSDDVARVYARLGFRRIGTAGAAEPPDPARP